MKLARIWSAFIAVQAASPLGLVGIQLTTFAFLSGVMLATLDMTGQFHNPYVGIVTYMIMPGMFVLGLLLILAARLIHNRRIGERLRLDMNQPKQRSLAAVFVGMTFFNLLFLGFMTYHSVEYADSNAFCGEVCHTIMEPEYTAYQNSAHSRVKCVDCHIGEGADFFVKYKINGLRQVWHASVGTYSRPIPAPVENLRPARETCERCHWPERFHGESLREITRYQEDEENTALKTVLMLKVGGSRNGTYHDGIHWHTDPRNQVTFTALDRELQDIARVVVTRDDGETVVYDNGDKDVDETLLAGGTAHELDCIGCHNRPTHEYEMPDDALDKALNSRAIDPSLPWIKKVAMEILTTEHESREVAFEEIPSKVSEYYRTEYAQLFEVESEAITSAANTVRDIYARNIWPQMRVTWGTYPSMIGHRDEEGGCFRCHAGNFTSAAGEEIVSDCDACHSILAYEEEDPEILQLLSESAF